MNIKKIKAIIILIVLIVIILLLSLHLSKLQRSYHISRYQRIPTKIIKEPIIKMHKLPNHVNNRYLKQGEKSKKQVNHLANDQKNHYVFNHKAIQPLLSTHQTIMTSSPQEENLARYQPKRTPTTLFPKTNWYIGIEGGANYISQSNTKQTPSQMVQHTFYIDNKFYGIRYGLMGGWTIARLTPNIFKKRFKKTNFIWFPAYHFGAIIWQLQNFTLTGDHTWQHPPSAIPTLVNIPYHYDVAVTAAEFQTIFDIFQWYRFTPFVGLGVGIADVNMSNYQEGYKIVNSIPVGGWKLENTNSRQLIYEIDFGIKYNLSAHWQMQLQYTYLPLTIKTGKYWINQGAPSAPKYFPELDQKVNMNTFLLGIRYQF